MTALIVDTSVVLKWFHSSGESEVDEAQTILAAHRTEFLTAHLLDLSIYEIGNVLLRGLRWSAADTADQIDDLLIICGPPLIPLPAWRRTATELAYQHGLSFYDAAFAAAAEAMDAPLVSADRKLLAAGLAESPSQTCKRLGLDVPRPLDS